MEYQDELFQLLSDLSDPNPLVIRRPYIERLGGNIKHALLLAQIVYWAGRCNNPDGWFYKSYDDWQREIFLSRHEVASGVEVLRGLGIIETEVRRAEGAPTVHYRVLISPFGKWICKKLTDPSVKNSHMDMRKSDRTETEPTTEPTTEQREDPPTPRESEKRKTEDREPIPEVLADLLCSDELGEALERLDLDDDVITFVQNAYRRGNRRAKLDNLRSKSNERLCEQIRQSEQEHGLETWRSALFGYLADTSEWLVKQKWPIRVFLSQVGKYGYSQTAPAPRHAIETASPIAQYPPTQPAVCNPRETANEIAAKWNQLVPSAPVALPLHATAATRLQSLLNVSEFADSFGVMAEKAEKIKAARGDDADWMDFHWLIRKPKNGEVENWQKLLSGEFNWMSNKRKSKGRDSPGDVVARALEASRERKERGMQ